MLNDEYIETKSGIGIDSKLKDKYIHYAIKGDKNAYSKLILDIEGKLYRISKSVLKEDADCMDAIQEALLRAWLKLPSLRDPSLFEHWLARILIHECYRIAKKRKSFNLAIQLVDSSSPDPAEHMIMEEAIYSLNINQRVPLVLHHIIGYKVHEIARMLKIPIGTVKSRLMRGRRQLKSIIMEESI